MPFLIFLYYFSFLNFIHTGFFSFFSPHTYPTHISIYSSFSFSSSLQTLFHSLALSFLLFLFLLDSRTLSSMIFWLLFLLLFSFLFISLHTHTADHDLLTSPLCLHFCFLFSFFFISLHSHTQPAERVGLHLSFFSFLFSSFFSCSDSLCCYNGA